MEETDRDAATQSGLDCEVFIVGGNVSKVWKVLGSSFLDSILSHSFSLLSSETGSGKFGEKIF
jgi:hypothetical protein